jgi:hypothetical protein
MDLQPLATTTWTAGALGFGALLLYGVGGSLDATDLLLLALGAAPVTVLGMVAFGWDPRLGRAGPGDP